MPKYTRRDMLKITAGAVAVSPLTGGEPRAMARRVSPRSASPEPHANLYVAPHGNDAWSGKLAAANAERTDGPLASLVRARALVREMKRSQAADQPITVMVRGGKYYLPLSWGSKRLIGKWQARET